jgi:effector-binding domain-containing protein
MIEKIIFATIVSLVLFVAGGLLLPREVQVERSVEITRPVSTVFAVLNRPGSYPGWLSRPGREADMGFQSSGPVYGAGSRLSWSGDVRQSGKGWMEITESRQPASITARVWIEGQGEAESLIAVERIAGGARVTCAVRTDLALGRGVFGALVARYFGLLFDRWAGAGLEKHLSGLRAYTESLSETDFSGLVVEKTNVEPLDVLYVQRATSNPAHTNESAALASAFQQITSFMADHELELSSQPMTLTYTDGKGGSRREAAIPVQYVDIPAGGPVKWGRSPSGKVLRVVHRGAYENLALVQEKLKAWIAAHGYRAGHVSWEHYLSDPGITPPGERITHLFVSLEE